MTVDIPKIIIKLDDGREVEVIFDKKYYSTNAYAEYLKQYDVKVTPDWLRKLGERKEIETLEVIFSLNPEADKGYTSRIVQNDYKTFARIAKIGEYADIKRGRKKK